VTLDLLVEVRILVRQPLYTTGLATFMPQALFWFRNLAVTCRVDESRVGLGMKKTTTALIAVVVLAGCNGVGKTGTNHDPHSVDVLYAKIDAIDAAQQKDLQIKLDRIKREAEEQDRARR